MWGFFYDENGFVVKDRVGEQWNKFNTKDLNLDSFNTAETVKVTAITGKTS